MQNQSCFGGRLIVAPLVHLLLIPSTPMHLKLINNPLCYLTDHIIIREVQLKSCHTLIKKCSFNFFEQCSKVNTWKNIVNRHLSMLLPICQTDFFFYINTFNIDTPLHLCKTLSFLMNVVNIVIYYYSLTQNNYCTSVHWEGSFQLSLWWMCTHLAKAYEANSDLWIWAVQIRFDWRLIDSLSVASCIAEYMATGHDQDNNFLLFYFATCVKILKW